MDKESLLKQEIGLWIDRREAILVILTEGEEEIRHITSSNEKYAREPGRSHAANPGGLIGFTVEDQRDRKYANQLNNYYDEVIAVIRGADAIQIFGPGEAKGELIKRIGRNGLKARMPATEATDRMTDRQISAKVREHFLTKVGQEKPEIIIMEEPIKERKDHMIKKRQFSTREAHALGTQLKINWSQINLEQFRRGLEVELEHGAIDPETNVTGDDLALTGKIAWAHLKEIRDYYTRLDRMEAQAEAQFKSPVEP
jgi:hypothetical protein